MANSNVTVQNLVDDAFRMAELQPIFNVGGSQSEPALTIMNTVMNSVCAVDFPHKDNEINIPVFYTNSWQQDYASSVTNLSWLERGIVIDINSQQFPKPFRNVEVGRQLQQATGSNVNTSGVGLNGIAFLVNFFPNKSLYFGTWGLGNNGNASFGNNPVSGSVYTNPLGTGNMPSNPITQIRDANSNLLVLTGYGTEGSTAPVAPASSAAGVIATPGVGATTQWTVVDPNAQGFRILPIPNQTGVVWEFNLVGQAKPVRFTKLAQTLDPFSDEFEPTFRAGFIAQCYRYSPEAKVRAKFKDEWSMWLASLNEMRSKQDREPEENMFIPERGIMGGNRGGGVNAGWPFFGPRPGTNY